LLDLALRLWHASSRRRHVAKKKKTVAKAKKKVAARAKRPVAKKKAAVRAKRSAATKKAAPGKLARNAGKKSGAIESLDKLVGRLEDWQKEIINTLRGMVRSIEREATETVKWAQPVFELNGPFAFIRPASKHVTFGFWRGAEIRDPYNKLQGDGSKMKHVKLKTTNDAVLPSIIDYVRQAVALNREKGDPTKP
jgi:hypothetical protein